MPNASSAWPNRDRSLELLMRPLLSSLLVLAALQSAALAQTLPSSQPSAQLAPDSPVRRWFSDLASPDARQRDQARTQLMSLNRNQLDQLRSLVENNRPLAPAQLAALHEIVLQVYLKDEPYPSDASAGFLGIYWPDLTLNQFESRLGVPVQARIPGTPSFQMLRDGDMILGVLIQPDASLQQLPNLETPSVATLQQAIAKAGLHHTIGLDVLREGERIRVELELRPKLILSDVRPGALTDYVKAFRQKGEDYWQSQFMPLLHSGVS